jgi:Rieske Fe-S protein
VGPPSAYTTNGLHKVNGTTVLIGRDADGLYALTALCTHQFCNMNNYGSIQSTGVSCACHGSKFGNDGQVLRGPAFEPLQAYALALACDGTIHVDTSTVVPNSQRLKA